MVVAIDGPAGAGKSTVAKLVAKALDLRYLDTGAMYRCVALLAQRHGLTAADGQRAAELVRPLDIRFAEGEPQRVYLGKEDVTEFIRTPEISELASALSAHSDVRKLMAERQRKMVQVGGVVLEGRDTTTVTAPDADLKIFLTASMEERAKRRHSELLARGELITYEDLLKQIAERDHRDYTRDDSPLTKAPDAQIVETFGLLPEQVAAKIVELAKAR